MSRTQAERTEATRAKLIAAGRRLFGDAGFAATSIEDLAREADVTRGALYHHFPGKEALFTAVFEGAEEELMTAAGKAAARETDAWRRLHAGCRGFLRASRAPDLQRIVLLDAPAVLGWDGWHAAEERYALGVLRAAIEAAMAEGHLRRRPAGALAHLLLGALNEAAMVVARSSPRSAVSAQVEAEVEALIEGLRG